MSLILYGYKDRPHDFAVTKSGAALEDCPFTLDFTRRLERIRWLGIRNRWLGITVGLLVPVIHRGEEEGGYLIAVSHGQPYFEDIPKIWRQHIGGNRATHAEAVNGLVIAEDFGSHFSEDC